MGVTKTSLFTDEQNELAVMAKVIAHPARIAILQHLVRANRCINSDLVEELGLAQATVSQHLKELKNAGLIAGTVEGTSMCYCIDQSTFQLFKRRLSDVFDLKVSGEEGCC